MISILLFMFIQLIKYLLISNKWVIVLIPFKDRRWFLWQPLSASCLLCTGRLMHLYAVCVDCLEGVHKIICIKCKSRWDGSWHQLGTMYTYDILAASPCCQVGIDPTERAAGDIRLLPPSEDRGVRGTTAVRPEEVWGCVWSEQPQSSPKCSSDGWFTIGGIAVGNTMQSLKAIL